MQQHAHVTASKCIYGNSTAVRRAWLDYSMSRGWFGTLSSPCVRSDPSCLIHAITGLRCTCTDRCEGSLQKCTREPIRQVISTGHADWYISDLGSAVCEKAKGSFHEFGSRAVPPSLKPTGTRAYSIRCNEPVTRGNWFWLSVQRTAGGDYDAIICQELTIVSIFHETLDKTNFCSQPLLVARSKTCTFSAGTHVWVELSEDEHFAVVPADHNLKQAVVASNCVLALPVFRQ